MAGEAESEGTGLVFHPLDQFKIHPLFGDGPIAWYTPTNVTLWMGIALLCIIPQHAVKAGSCGEIRSFRDAHRMAQQ